MIDFHIHSIDLHLQRVISSYNRDNAHLLRFEGLHRFFAKCINAETADHYLHTVVPAMARLALRIRHLCSQVCFDEA